MSHAIRIRRGKVVTGGVVVATVLIVAAVAVIAWRPTGSVPASGEDLLTTTVELTTLVETATVNGKLAYGPERAAESRLPGTITALPDVASTVDQGGTLFRIDDTPVVVLFGSLPAYRELSAGRAAKKPATEKPATEKPANETTANETPATESIPAAEGADVKQFETNLRELGYTGFTVDEDFTASTAAAVRRWQKDLGIEQTGVVELGRVVYTPGPVRIAKHQLVAGARADGPVLYYTGTTRLVTAAIPLYQQDLAKTKAKVTVELGSGASVNGSVVSVRTPTDDAAQGGEPTVQAVVTLDDAESLKSVDDGAVRVRFVVREREDVLAVPVGALLALAEGGYGLQVVADDSQPPGRIVAVTTGVFADGRVEVSGPDVREGMTVGMAQ